MRVLKEPEVRRNEILDAAEELFASKGFDNTSTNDILERCGIARGTLYYHFKSKEDVLDGVISRMTEQAMKRAADICADGNIPVLGRLTSAVMALNIGSEQNSVFTKLIHKPQNALMHQKMQTMLISGVVPIISGLVKDGIQQGIFRTDRPDEAVEMIILYSNIMFDELEAQSGAEKQKRISGFIYNTERLLGTAEGALSETIMKIFDK